MYKIEVKSQGKSWFVFRRYSDFIRLNDRVSENAKQSQFPHLLHIFRVWKLQGRLHMKQGHLWRPCEMTYYTIAKQ